MNAQRILTGQSEQQKVQNGREVRGDRFEHKSCIATELWMSGQELRSLSAKQWIPLLNQENKMLTQIN